MSCPPLLPLFALELIDHAERLWPFALAAAALAGVAIWAGRRHRRKEGAGRITEDALWERILESQEQERRRIAGDLHDSLAQNILVIRNRALLGLEQPGRPEAATEQFQEILKTSSLALEEVRRTVHNLSTHHVKQLGLTEALDAMIDRMAGPAGLRVERHLEPVDGHFSDESAVQIYRIAQEALNNVCKHARATSVRIRLAADVRHLEFTVEDDGRGFDGKVAAPRSGGLGLVEMDRRTRLLGGALEVGSRQGRGTHLRVNLPLKPDGRI